MENADSSSIIDVNMTSPSTGNELSFIPNVDRFVRRKTRVINSPNVNSDDTPEGNIFQGSSQQLVSTPVATSGIASKRSRRDDLRVNPFEKNLLEQLHRSVWSPSILQQTVSETPPQLHWSVDQISMLNPSKIEESPSTHQNEEVLTPQTEARAQRAITRFFSENIVPSPSSPLNLNPIFTNSNKMDEEGGQIHNSTGETSGTANEALCSKATNTDISFPKVLPPDVEQMLLSFSTPVSDGDTTALNSSLRRRKLDFTLSPTGTEENNMEINQSPTCGEIYHSPGIIQAGQSVSPRQFREGLESPNFTPIKGSN